MFMNSGMIQVLCGLGLLPTSSDLLLNVPSKWLCCLLLLLPFGKLLTADNANTDISNYSIISKTISKFIVWAHFVFSIRF